MQTPIASISVSENTEHKPQSKVWEHDSEWFSVLPNNSGTWLWRLDSNAWSPVLQLSSDDSTKADVKVNGDLAHVLMFQGSTSELVTVEYAGAGDYSLWSAQPQIVSVPLGSSVESATLEVDSTGRMWVAYDRRNEIEVRYSDGLYTSFSAPIVVANGITSDDISSIIAMPGGSIGVFWSDQNSELFGFRTHVDGTNPQTWSANELPASQSAKSTGGGFSDDHVNLATSSDGTLYAAVKTSYDSSTHESIALLVRRPNGVWDDVYAVANSGTRPIVIVSETHDELAVVYTRSTNGGDIVLRGTSLDDIALGPTQIVLDGSFNNATSSKRAMGQELLVLAHRSGSAYGSLIDLGPIDGGPTNLAPVVGAGADQTITLPSIANLSGLASDDGEPFGTLTTTWSMVNGPGTVNFGNANATSTTASFSQAGTYVLRLTANDGALQSSDQVTIQVNAAPQQNTAPQVNAGANQTITLPNSVNLNGSASDDGLPSGTLTTAWSMVNGPGTVNFGNANATSTTASFSQAGTYVLQLTASDGALQSSDQVTVQVNTPTSGPTTVSFQDGVNGYQGTRDTMLLGNSQNATSGSDTSLNVDGRPDTSVLISWDTSAIPQDSVIESAMITLQVTNKTSDSYPIYAVNRAWSESQATWAVASQGVNWSTAGAQGSSDRGTTAIGQLSPSSTGEYTISLNAAGIALVQSWVNSPGSNFGIIVQNYSSASNGADFHSREVSSASTRPELSVTYTGGGPISNQAPQVNAGSNQTITLPSIANLSGSASDDGEPSGTLTTTWSMVSGPGTVNFGNANATSTTASFSQAGTYVLQLTASDGALQSSDQVTVEVNSETQQNTAPQVNAGSNQTITLPNSANLNGSASDDGEPFGTLTTTWSMVNGPGTVNFGNANATSTTASFGQAGTYVLQLTANDGALQSSDQVTIQVNAAPQQNTAPQVNAGANQTITLPNSVNLSGSASDDGLPSGTLTTTWSMVNGPGTVNFGNANATSTTASFSQAGTYVLQLTASDGALQSSDQVTVQVNTPTSGPTTVSFQDGVNGYQGTRDTMLLGNSQNATSGSDTSLNVDGRPDTSVLISWDTSAIPQDSVIESAMITLQVTNKTSDSYPIYAVNRAWSESQATWAVASQGVNWSTAGAQGSADRGTTAIGQLSPSSTGEYTISLNAAGIALVQSWVNSPGSNFGIIIQNYSSASNGADFHSREVSSASTRPELSVTYTGGGPISNQAPQVNAGSNQTITLPSIANLSGSASDDGQPSGTLTTTWSMVNGPGTVNFGNANATSTTASFSQAGTYVLQLTASDGALQSSDQVTVEVNSETQQNTAPQVNAGSNQTITLPNSANLNGSASDDGQPSGTLTTTWSMVNGPGTVNFGNANATSTTASFSQAGTYLLQLTASDGALQSSDQVTIQVNAAPQQNTAPQVNAGANQTITLPSIANLSGSASDDGLPSGTLTTAWSMVNGPGTVNFGNANATSTTASFSQAGTYVLQLTASDGALQSSDQVTVQVQADPDPPQGAAGLVGWWTLDGDGTDQSGNGNHGTSAGSATYGAGRIGGALLQSNRDDRVIVPDSSSLDINDTITLAAWIRPDRSGTQYFLNKKEQGGTDGFELSLSSSGKIFVRFNQDSSGNSYRLNSSTEYPTDGQTWLHVAATYDGSTIRIYVNGQLEGSKSANFQIATNDLPLVIGAEQDGYRGMTGAIDDVHVYSRALLDQEVFSLYNS